MTDTRYLHVTVRCPSCGHSVDLGAYEATLDLDLDYMSLQGGFRGAHRCSPPEPVGIVEFRGDLDDETERKLLDAFRRAVRNRGGAAW